MNTKAYLSACPRVAALAVALSLSGAAVAQERSDGSTDIRRLVAEAATEAGIPFEIADAVVAIESRYNPRARSAGHFGLTQISLATARAQGYAGGAAGLLDARTNLRFGLHYLAQAYQLADGDTCGTVLRYQAGHRATAMTGAARRYCDRVQSLALVSALY